MKFLMFTFIRKQLKVFNAVIIFDAVDMMNSFFGFEVSPDMNFNNQPVFKNVILGIRKRVPMFFNKNISLIVFCFATFPLVAFGAFLAFAYFTFSFFGTVFAFIVFPKTFPGTIFSSIFSAKNNIKNLIANFTYFFNFHNILQLKKAAFGGLLRIQLNILHLLTALSLQKKSALLIDNISISYLINFVKKKMEIKTWVLSPQD